MSTEQQFVDQFTGQRFRIGGVRIGLTPTVLVSLPEAKFPVLILFSFELTRASAAGVALRDFFRH
jgi:hypothetical protein